MRRRPESNLTISADQVRGGRLGLTEVYGYKIDPGADLTGTNLFDANLTRATMPDGTIHK